MIPGLKFLDQAELDSLGGYDFRETLLEHIIPFESLPSHLVFESIPEVCVDM